VRHAPQYTGRLAAGDLTGGSPTVDLKVDGHELQKFVAAGPWSGGQ
jgi:hypothetical protein